MTVQEFIRAKRVQEACRLLSTTDRTIKSIAAAVGVPDLAQFNKLIRAETGTSPRKFRSTPEHL
jgi:AraC-like DNA-binding protein